MSQPWVAGLARVLIASVFVVMGGYRLALAFGLLGAPALALAPATLAFSAAELVLGLLILFGWRVAVLGVLGALLLAVDAVMSHPFWDRSGAEAGAQLLHFMKNVCAIGAFLLLAHGATRRGGRLR